MVTRTEELFVDVDLSLPSSQELDGSVDAPDVDEHGRDDQSNQHVPYVRSQTRASWYWFLLVIYGFFLVSQGLGGVFRVGQRFDS